MTNTTEQKAQRGSVSEQQECHRSFVFSSWTGNNHPRSRSLNDLDCCITGHGFQNCKLHERCSSSDEALEAAAGTNVYPLVPTQPPLFRTPTPPGLPEFGSTEAQQLRLMPPSRFTRLTSQLRGRLSRIGQNPDNNVQEHGHEHNSPQNDAERQQLQEGQFGMSAETLRRMMGTTRPVSLTGDFRKARRVSLPRGVIRTSAIGFLAQAEDGSQVRGRFGNRASGHGVGSRTIGVHPLGRLRESSGLQAEVNAIDKACARQQRRQRQESHDLPQNSSEVQRLESRRLRAALIIREAPSAAASTRAIYQGHHQSNSTVGASEQRTARMCRLTEENTRRLQVTSNHIASVQHRPK